MFGRFKSAKCTALLKQCAARIQVLRPQRELRGKQITREIAELLRQGQDARALLQVELKLREEATLAAYDVIAVCCGTVCARMLMIEGTKKCPHFLKGEIATIIFAAPRCGDLAELQELKAMLTAKFGRDFAAAAAELRPDCGVDPRVVDALAVHAPSAEAKLRALTAITAENHIGWRPPSAHADMSAPQPHAQEAPPRDSPRLPRTPPGQRPPSPVTPLAHHPFTTPDPMGLPEAASGAYGGSEAGPYRPPPPPDSHLPALRMQGSGADPAGQASGTPGTWHAGGGGPVSPLPDRLSPRAWPDEQDGRREPARTQPQAGYAFGGYAPAPGGLDDYPDATAAALDFAAQQVSYLARSVVANHVREREARLREQLRSERDGRAGEDQRRSPGPQYGGAERQGWGQASGEWGAHLARGETRSGRQWDGESSSQQRSPRAAGPWGSPEGGGYAQHEQGPRDRDGRGGPPRRTSYSAGGTVEEQGARQRASQDFPTPRPASPDSLARRSSDRDNSSEDDNSPGAGGGAPRGGTQRAAEQEAGPAALAGRRGNGVPNERQRYVAHDDVRSPRSAEGPQGGSLPPPPKHAHQRGQFLKWSGPAAGDKPYGERPLSPTAGVNGLTSSVRALRVGK